MSASFSPSVFAPANVAAAYEAYKASAMRRSANRERVMLMPFWMWFSVIYVKSI